MKKFFSVGDVGNQNFFTASSLSGAQARGQVVTSFRMK